MPRKHCFDEKCLDLARYFYPHAADHWLRDLAQQFQDVAESAEDIQGTAPETRQVPVAVDHEGKSVFPLADHPRDANGSPVADTVPKGHFWRGRFDRFRCRNCGEHYDAHLHTDEASTCPAAEASDRQWLIRKRGYYYRPNRAGYTPSIAEAGHYTEAEAKAEAAIEPAIMQAIPLSQAISDATTQNREGEYG